MGRPAKSRKTATGTILKEDEIRRELSEKVLCGDSDALDPPEWLTDSQKQIFEFITGNLDEAKIFGNIDVIVLTRAVVVIDSLEKFEHKINENSSVLSDSKVMANYDRLSKLFARYCNELSLSPQARAKLSISAASLGNGNEKPKTIMGMLNDEDE